MQRINLLKKYIENKEVLDIGCIDHSWRKHQGKNWLHKKIKGYAKSLTGIDYLQEDVEELNQLGYTIVYANAENFDLKKKFDVVFAGELIEHLSNVGLFLNSVQKHLNQNSFFILTTPNAFALGNIIRIILKIFGLEMNDNPEHTHWYDQQTLRQVLERNGFEMVECFTFYPDRYPRFLDWLVPNTVRSKIFVVARLKSSSIRCPEG